MHAAMLLAAVGLSAGLAAPVSTDPPPAPTVQQGRDLIARRDFAAAERVLYAIIKDQPTHAEAWAMLGYARHAQGKLDEALAAHQKAASFPQTQINGSYNAACVYALKGDKDQALEWLAKAVAAGFRDRRQLDSDDDLKSLRDDPRFARLIPPLLRGADAFVEPVRVIHEIHGESGNEQFGWVARVVGDLDGDRILDFAVTAPTKVIGGPAAGRVSVFSGRTGKKLFSRDGSPGQMLGNSVAPAGDVNGDGVPDVFTGAPAGGTGPGRAFVFSGKDGSTLAEFASGQVGDNFGLKLCAVGDLTGDGVPELAIGATTADAEDREDCGKVFVFCGKSAAVLYELTGERSGDQFGSALDATTDGTRRLLVIGAMHAGPGQRGRAYVFRPSARGAEQLWTIEAAETGQNLGQYFVSIIGDIDADSVPDVYASDFSDTAKGPHTGRVLVHSGKDGKRLLDIPGHVAGEGFGTSPSAAGDTNGDGHADLIVGAWRNGDAAVSAGKCYLYSGKDGSLLRTITCRQAGDTFGFDAVGLGDVDGDGSVDFLLTSGWSAIVGPRTGRVFVVAGTPPPSRDAVK